jgi:hypothetical protein
MKDLITAKNRLDNQDDETISDILWTGFCAIMIAIISYQLLAGVLL